MLHARKVIGMEAFFLPASDERVSSDPWPVGHAMTHHWIDKALIWCPQRTG